MKPMFLNDLTIMRWYLVQTYGICVAVGLFMGVAMGSLLTMGACIAAMIPLLTAFSLLSYDELNNWQAYRLAMPLSRNDIVSGRYLCILAVALASALLGLATSFLVGLIAQLLGPASMIAALSFESNPPGLVVASTLFGLGASLIMAAALIPPAMKSGMTKGVRFAPFIIMFVFLAGASLLGDDGVLAPYIPRMLDLFGSSDMGAVAAAGIMCVAALVLLAISHQATRRLYATRDF